MGNFANLKSAGAFAPSSIVMDANLNGEVNKTTTNILNSGSNEPLSATDAPSEDNIIDKNNENIDYSKWGVAIGFEACLLITGIAVGIFSLKRKSKV